MKVAKKVETIPRCYSFNVDRKRGSYSVVTDCEFFTLCEKIEFQGFQTLPKGFFQNGYGFARPAGLFLTKALLAQFGQKIRLAISATQKTGATKKGKGWHLIFNHKDYLRILEGLREFNKDKNNKSNALVEYELQSLFTLKRKKGQPQALNPNKYEADRLFKFASNNDDLHKQLSKADIDTIIDLYSKVSTLKQVEFKSIGIAEDAKRKNETVYLSSVIKEFKSRLLQKSLSEADWQHFLGNYVLLFNTSYVKVIEKLNIDLLGKYPDFVLINLYGYIDVYEIKKPDTKLLMHDDGRGNYFWDKEVSKALIQTEKYVQLLQKQALQVREAIKTKYGLDVKVVRPRGYIVVGRSEQFTDQKMNDDFRVLASASKNVDIILYDELLGNLENLLGRLKGKTKTPALKGRSQT